MIKSKIQIVSNDLWLEILLKQYFKDIEVTTSIVEEVADIIKLELKHSGFPLRTH